MIVVQTLQMLCKIGSHVAGDAYALIMSLSMPQGDVMSGAIATFYGWATEGLKAGSQDAAKATAKFSATVLGAYGGTLTARYAAKAAFARRKRSMIAADLIEEVGFAVDELFDKS